MPQDLATYPGHRFPAEIISHAVWLYHVFSLSLRDVELLLAERGITVTHESVRQWCRKFGGDFAAKLRRRRPKPGDTWHMDEVFIRHCQLGGLQGAFDHAAALRRHYAATWAQVSCRQIRKALARARRY